MCIITENNKREHGIYYTKLINPFKLAPFKEWVDTHNLKKEPVLEPFAGSNSIIEMLQDIGMADTYVSYDIYPHSQNVQKRDTIKNYPVGHSLCITNPPWVYKASAHRRGLNFPSTHYDNVYKLCLSLALEHNTFVGALIPASFIQSGVFLERLEKLIMINSRLFTDTDNPVCLALFGSDITKEVYVYDNDTFIGEYGELKNYLPKQEKKRNSLMFNNPEGELGLVAIDNTVEPSIRFCEGRDLSKYCISSRSRSITRISGFSYVKELNEYLDEMRRKTHDIFLTAFKGLRKDGKYRRRIAYSLARDIINHVERYV